jgi:hypothetical protein
MVSARADLSVIVTTGSVSETSFKARIRIRAQAFGPTKADVRLTERSSPTDKYIRALKGMAELERC